MRKVFVRFLASARQQREMFRAFLAKDFIRGVPLLLKNSILTSSLAGQKLRNGRPRGRAIGPGARGRQQIVRTASCAADDSIGRLVDSDVLTGPIRLFALDPQAFVGLFALKAPLLVFWRHRSREVYTSALIVLTPNNQAQGCSYAAPKYRRDAGRPAIRQAGCSAVGSATPSLLPTSKYVLSAPGPSMGSKYVFRAVMESASHTQMAALPSGVGNEWCSFRWAGSDGSAAWARFQVLAGSLI